MTGHAKRRPAPRHHESTAAVATTCTCGAAILVCLDEGLNVRADPAPLPDAAAEIAARLAGLATYTQFRGGELAYRDEYRILRREYPVLAQHKCEGKK